MFTKRASVRMGLARLCGIESRSLSVRILDVLDGKTDGAKMLPKGLGTLQGKTFQMELNKPGLPARLVPAKTAARIIRYYAYESKAANETAKFSYDKFAEMGMETWIKQVVGYSEEPVTDLTKMMNMMQELMGEVKELRADVKQLNNFKVASVTLPGLQQQFDGYANQEKALDSAQFTLNQWLATKGITLSRGQMCSIGRMMADLYKVNRQEQPEKVAAYRLGLKGRGGVTVYRASDTPMLEAALMKVVK